MRVRGAGMALLAAVLFGASTPLAKGLLQDTTPQLRTVEVFTAGCSVCDEALEAVRGVVCESCDLQVHDMKTKPAQAKARQYGIKRVPAVVVNGRLAVCCQQSAVDVKTLQRLGVGQRA